MTNENITMNISVEKIVHQGLISFVQELYSSHGLVVREVRFNWIDVDTVSEPARLCVSCELDSMFLVSGKDES